MAIAWGPTGWGKTLTSTVPWQLMLNGDELRFLISGKIFKTNVMASEGLTVVPGMVWAAVHFKIESQKTLKLDGIPNAVAQDMVEALQHARLAYQHNLKVKKLISTFDASVKPMGDWGRQVIAAAKQHLNSKGWLTGEFTAVWAGKKPGNVLKAELELPELKAHLAAQPDTVQKSIQLWQRDFSGFITGINERHVESELSACKDFFDKVEKSPLTDEQARAVLCFDNRVQVIASAGSGKTSTMVAKAGYALYRKLIPADKILLLAFNNEAAKELQQRIRDRLLPLGFPADLIMARTFHAFGLDVIGAVTGQKPTLAPWLESSGDLRQLMTIVDELRDGNTDFRIQWDLFRLVLGRDLPEFGKEQESPEDWDRDSKATGFRTLQGEVVKSQGERLIADWLFYNGVEYRYETPYAVNTADPQHRQYRPDFYYPAIDTYHEHWALDAKGLPPKEFAGYLNGVAWKRALHRDQGTALLETTMAQLWSGNAFEYLAKELTQRGITLDPNPDRPVQGRLPIENDGLVRTFRTFLTHAKGNRLDDRQLLERLNAEPSGKFQFRHQAFLKLFNAIRQAWEHKLTVEGVIDFEDMLNLATDHLESGRWRSPFELVMVDEFQDASLARARIARALVNQPGRYLFAVGDDWQSINRFAGADLSVMTGFESWFGKGQTLRLERTFRCPQPICDVSSKFVLNNPNQLKKKVLSSTKEYAPSVEALQVPSDAQIASAIRQRLSALHVQLASGQLQPGKDGTVSVFVLGRYRRDDVFVPRWQDLADRVQVKFLTIHGSKGLEADYVILPRVASGRYGFPSTMEDDPVLQLAMPEGEDFPLAEERRLFYVALTRARRSVLLITVQHRESSFMIELEKHHGIKAMNLTGEVTNAHVCPKCSKGTMVPRKGPYGPFLGCSHFPACKNIIKVKR